MKNREMVEKQNTLHQVEEIDIKGILIKYLNYWYLFLLGILVSVGTAFLYLRYSVPLYSVSSTLLVKDYQNNPDVFGNAAFHDIELFNTFKNIKNEIYVLKSQRLMRETLAELEMNTSFYVEGKVKTSELYGNSLPIKIFVHSLKPDGFYKFVKFQIIGNNKFELVENENKINTYSFGQKITTDFAEFTVIANSTIEESMPKKVIVQFHDINSLAGIYSSKLNVALLDKESSVLQISLNDPQPEKAKDIVNKLIEVYNKETIEDKNQIAANTIEFIDERLKFLTNELVAVEKDVEEYKRQNKLADVSSSAELYLQKASNYNQQLADLEIHLDVLKSIETYLKRSQNQYDLAPTTLNIDDPILYGLINKFNELQIEREKILRETKPNNPLVLNISSQLENLRLNILENISNIQGNLQITKRNLQASSSQFESRIQQVPAIERELLEINREQGIKQGLYLYLLEKREEAALSLAATAPSSRVIDAAMGSIFPVSPKSRLIYIIAFLMGLGVPLGFIYVKELLNDKVQDKQGVERVTKAPILGEIAHKQTGETLVVKEDSRTPVAELFRLIRSNLQYATPGKENKVLLVTSSMSGEGKTFFSINLAATLALVGKKVLIIDFDLRKPRLASYLGLPNDLGITNYLISDKFSPKELIRPSKIFENLFLVSAGPIPPNPAELLQSPKVGDLIKQLKNDFDYVLVDTSPVGQVADALSLNPYIDSSIYLVRYDYTNKKQLSLVEDIYANKKLKNLMIVLNDAKKKNGYGYGYGYGYGIDKK